MSWNESVNDFASRIKKIHEEMSSALEKAASDMKKYANRKGSDVPEYQFGDQVWLDASDIRQNRLSEKLSDKKLGPF
jgi:glycosylphosphatidylinositol phospholipase D